MIFLTAFFRTDRFIVFYYLVCNFQHSADILHDHNLRRKFLNSFDVILIQFISRIIDYPMMLIGRTEALARRSPYDNVYIFVNIVFDPVHYFSYVTTNNIILQNFGMVILICFDTKVIYIVCKNHTTAFSNES